MLGFRFRKIRRVGMGGFNSSRWHEHKKKNLVEDYKALAATALVRAGINKPINLSWTDPATGKDIEPTGCALDKDRDGNLSLSLCFPLRLQDGKTKINLLAT